MTADTAKILVVEFDSGASSPLAASLEGQGYRVIACKTGDEALERVRQTPPDLVIVELGLPGVDALKILEQLKELKPGAGFISIAGPDDLDTAVKALEEGAFAYVSRPFNLHEVYSLVSNGLKLQKLLLENERLVGRLQRSNTELSEEVAERKWTEGILAKRTAALEVANKELLALNAAERARSQQRLQEASRLMAVGELAAGIAHELNNPLAAVMTFAHLLKLQDLPGPVAEDVGKIYSEAQRAAKAVQHLLSFARTPKPEKQYIDVLGALERALALKAYDLRVNNIEVRTHFDPRLPKTMADEYQLTQVFLNIITNAETAMTVAGGGGTLTVAVEDEEDIVRIILADDGPGITPENLGKVFDPFFTTNEDGKGTGLGLSMCARMVSAHGGRIWAESRLTEGATFYVELPVLEQEDVVPEPPQEKPSKILGKRLLLIDDEVLLVESLSRALSQAGHIVDVAPNGAEAWGKIRREDYDCIIMDLKMPGTGAKELYARLQKRDSRLARKVIFVTGDILNAKAQEFIAATGNPWLGKPFALEDLDQRIQACLALSD